MALMLTYITIHAKLRSFERSIDILTRDNYEQKIFFSES